MTARPETVEAMGLVLSGARLKAAAEVADRLVALAYTEAFAKGQEHGYEAAQEEGQRLVAEAVTTERRRIRELVTERAARLKPSISDADVGASIAFDAVLHDLDSGGGSDE